MRGAAFTRWMLLITQISLVSAGQVDIHRKLGIAGFLPASLMAVLGTLAATKAASSSPIVASRIGRLSVLESRRVRKASKTIVAAVAIRRSQANRRALLQDLN
jgi:hypothetical protein